MQIKKTDFKGLFIFIDATMAIARTSAKLSKNRRFWTKVNEKKRSKKVNETQVSKTVFSRLNLKAAVNKISKRNRLR